ncbi:oxidoreductase [Microtetraspora sp. NBRC 13810]|uniref:globin domain-containing protein n=1 Tax=Microtetraspora sp. NBRC 13810 TaxID=3030990 RepID=UPI0024A0DC20|nr:globin domain-containing protein [Microtetraspora sp. NBRC 13810]GLW06557.1 oxidoreductase [Microtetraspora sp. NBRC 13810]
MALNPRLVKESFAHIEPHGAKAAAYFYGRLFAVDPRLRRLFPPALDVQRDRLFAALTRIVWSLDSPGTLAGFLGQLGRDHRKYGVTAEHYAAVGEALLATVRRFAADAWTPEVAAAWTEAYAVASSIMIDAAADDGGDAPAWWPAEVVGHERRTGDIAVVTLRPATPLPYEPGQYVTLQTTRWPRVWRAFSIANAPRPDNTLTLHVRAVPGGWVSTTLTAHTQVGDTVTLGPALGGMRPPADPGRDVLAVAGGTGLAPLKAIIEHLLAADRQPTIDLLYGARHAGELYDLPDLTRLQAECPRLRVLPVVSDDPGYGGLRGRLPDVVSRFRPWNRHTAYVCGPPAMVEETVRHLRRDGVPLDHIHRDLTPGER